MTKASVIIGVDPGTTTGVAVWSADQRRFFTTIELHGPQSAVDSIGGLIQLFTQYGYSIAITQERVDLNPEELRGKTQDGLRDALKVSSVLWFLAELYDCAYTEVLRSNAKTFVSDQQLKEHAWHHESRHVRDAMRTVITHLVTIDRTFLTEVWAN